MALFLWMAFGLLLTHHVVWAAVIAAVFLLMLPIGMWLRFLVKSMRILPIRKAWKEKVIKAFLFAQTMTIKRYGLILGLGLISFGVEWLQYWAFFNLFASPNMAISFGTAVGVATIVTLANVVQISMAGLGFREWLTAVLLANHLPAAAAALGAFLVFFLDFAIPGMVGLFIKPIVTSDEATLPSKSDTMQGGHEK